VILARKKRGGGFRKIAIKNGLFQLFRSLRMKQLHGFDELCNDKGLIQNSTVKIDKTGLLLSLSVSYLFQFSLLLTTPTGVN
jgi:hypothetical protein